MEQYPEVIIIGGGVIGCSLAYQLSKQKISVTVLERGEPGGQASNAAAGLFSWLKPQTKVDPLDDYSQLLLGSHALFPELVAELESLTGLHLEYEQIGTLRTIHHETRLSRVTRWVQACQLAGLQVEFLSEAETRRREPLLASDLFGALSFPSEGQVRATRFVEALVRGAQSYGAVVRSQTEVVALQRNGSHIQGVITASGEIIACQHVVLASGAWAAHSGGWLDIDLPVHPQRGQILSLRQPASPIKQILIGKGIYVAPKQDGTVFVGATNDDVGFDTRVTAGGVQTLLDAALKLVPALAECAFERAWAGLRPKTTDNHPILGAVPGWDNVTLAIGHYSFGVLLSAITAQELTTFITTGKTSDLLQPFTIDRFFTKLLSQNPEESTTS